VSRCSFYHSTEIRKAGGGHLGRRGYAARPRARDCRHRRSRSDLESAQERARHTVRCSRRLNVYDAEYAYKRGAVGHRSAGCTLYATRLTRSRHRQTTQRLWLRGSGSHCTFLSGETMRTLKPTQCRQPAHRPRQLLQRYPYFRVARRGTMRPSRPGDTGQQRRFPETSPQLVAFASETVEHQTDHAYALGPYRLGEERTVRMFSPLRAVCRRSACMSRHRRPDPRIASPDFGQTQSEIRAAADYAVAQRTLSGSAI
jgi:hypothetical protein